MRSCTFWLRYGTPSGSGKYIIRSVFKIEPEAERTTIIVDIFDFIQQVRDTGIHLKVLVLIYKGPKSSRGPQRRSERQVGGECTHTCHKATTRLLHNTNYSKSANKSLAKACAFRVFCTTTVIMMIVLDPPAFGL